MVKLPGDAAPQSFDFDAEETRLPEQDEPQAVVPVAPPKPAPAVTPDPQDDEKSVMAELARLSGGEPLQPPPQNELMRDLEPIAKNIQYARQMEAATRESVAKAESAVRQVRAKVGIEPGKQTGDDWMSKPVTMPAEMQPRRTVLDEGREVAARRANRYQNEQDPFRAAKDWFVYRSAEEQKQWGEDEVKANELRLKQRQERIDEAQADIDAWKARFPDRDVPEIKQRRLERAKRLYQQYVPVIEAELAQAKAIAAGKAPGPQLTKAADLVRGFAKSVVGTAGMAVSSAGVAGNILERALGYDTNLLEGDLFEAGLAIDRWSQEQFPTDPLLAKDFSTSVAAGLGSTMIFYGAGGTAAGLARLARMSPRQRLAFGTSASAGLGGLVGGAEGVQRIMEHVKKGGEVTNRDVILAYMLTVGGGATEAVPVLSWLRSKKGGDVIAGILEQSLEEGIQEGATQAWQNTVEGLIYNPERHPLDGVFDAAAVGFITGGVMEAGRAAVMPSAPEGLVAPPPEIEEPQASPSPERAQPAPTPPTGQDAEAELPQPTITPTDPEELAARPKPAQPARDAAQAATSGEAVATKPYEPPRAVPREVVTPDGSMRVDTETVLIELDDLKYASGDLQPRNRSRQEYEIGVRERAANLDPARLMPERVSDGGAPIITPDGTIVSGNGRVMSLEMVYGDNALASRAQAYREALGPEAADMRRPVLVRRVAQDLEPSELVKFADLSNRSSIAQMSASEMAQRDAKAAGAEVMQLYQGGAFDSRENQPFLRAFVNAAVTPSERVQMAAGGRLTLDGDKRIRNALLAASYGDLDAVERLTEARDDNVKAMSGAMLDITGFIQQLRASIDRGETDPQFDITPQIVEAVRRISKMREDGIRPADALRQQDAFEQIDPIVEAIIRGFYNESLTRAVSRKKMTELLQLYLEEAQGHTSRFLPDETSPQDVLSNAVVVAEQRAAARAADDAGLFADGAGVAGGPDAGDGVGDGGPRPASGGQATGTEADEVNLNTDEFAAKFIRRETAPPVDKDQLDFFAEVFGPQDGDPVVAMDATPTDAMRAAFSQVLAGKAPRARWGEETAALIEGDLTEPQLDVLVAEALDQGLLKEGKGGRITRTPAAKTQALRARGQVTETEPTIDDVVEAVAEDLGATPEEVIAAADEVIAAVDESVAADAITGAEAYGTPIDTSGIQTVEDLTSFLQSYGIDTDAYGTKEAKSLNALLGELQKGESQLLDRNGKLVREVSSLALDIYVTLDDGRFKLYEDRQDFRDGRTRRRPLDSSLGEKLEAGEDPQATIARALEEEIGVTRFTQTSDISFSKDELLSPSYPGILGSYTTYRASVEIDPADYRDEYVEEQAEKVNVMQWFPVLDGDERSPNIPGSPLNMETREARARNYMQSGSYTFPEGSDAPKSLWGRTVGYQEATQPDDSKDTSRVDGYWSDEWKANRRYTVTEAGGVKREIGFDEAIDWLEQKFIADAGGVDAIARERKAYIVIGLPGAGKSTLIDPMIKHVRAIHVVADETKKIIPEFEDGANSGGVHEESSDMTKLVQQRLIDAGYNLVLEKIGGTVASIEKEITKAVANNYTPQLFMVDVPAPVAMERAIGRFQSTGRAVSEQVYDADIGGTYTTLKVREEVTGYGRFEWKEPDGWQWQETGSDDLTGFAFRDRFSGVRIAYDRDVPVGDGFVDGRDRYQIDGQTPDPAVQGEALRDRELDDAGPGEIPALVASDLGRTDFARERAEAAIAAYEADNPALDIPPALFEDVLRIELSRTSPEETQAVVDELAQDKGFKRVDALRLADIVGYPTKAKTRKKEAFASIVERTRDMIANREVAELIVEGQDVLREDAGGVPGSAAPGDVRVSQEGGQAGRALQGDRAGGDAAQGGVGDRPVDGAAPGGSAGATADEGAAGRLRDDTGAGERDRIDRDRLRAVVAEQEAARQERRAQNYRITDEDEVGRGTEKQKVRANLDAIRVLRTLEQENRPPTAEEKRALARYTGWGAFAQAMFDTRSEGNAKKWAKERAELKDLVSPEEYAAAGESTLNAHFTSPEVVEAMWGAMRYLGFSGGRVLEPAAGSGNFIGMMPTDLASNSDWTAVELDKLTGAIAKNLYAGADVRIAGFETQNWPDNFFDASVSNVPFGDYKLRDTTNPDYKGLLIHDYFIVKGLDKVRPGGLVAYITSAGTMDKQDARARKLMAKRADLVGAIRLPGGNKGAFAANAGTEVTTDILFFQKRGPGQQPADTSWTETVDYETPEGNTRLNRYFAENPNMMLGDMRLMGTMYRKDSPVLIGPTDRMAERIMKAAEEGLPEGVFVRRGERIADPVEPEVDAAATGVKEGAFYEKDGKIYRRVAGVGQPVKATATNARKIKAFLAIRDVYNKLLGDQARGIREGQDALRADLHRTYDAFVKKFGPINKTDVTVTKRTDSRGNQIVIRKMPNFEPFRADPDAFKVASLEAYDENTGRAAKAAVFDEDVLVEYQRPAVQSEADALAISLNERGKVDIPFLAETLEVSEEEAVAALGDMVFLNPSSGEYETTAVYLSGDVVGKLEDARRAAETDPQFVRHVEALENVQPPPLTRVDIRVLMGAPWIDASYYRQFLEQEIGGRNVEVVFLSASKRWKIESGYFSGDVRNKWGHGRAELEKILEAAMNNTSITVKDKVSDGDGGTTEITNQKATEEVQSRIDQIRAAFGGSPELGIDGWVWADEARAQELEAIYNNRFNRLVARTYDGSHLTFPGMARVVSFPDGSKGEIRLPDYRTGVIWRILSEGNTLMAHGVGAGKTFSSIMSGMEQKRLGLIQRPAYVVPNHMLEQFSREFLQVYPNAKLLVADKDSMSKDKRREFAARVAAERWDGVIITHDAFGRISMSDDYVRDFMVDEIIALEDMLEQVVADGEDQRSPSFKDIQRKKKNLEERMFKLLNKERKDEGITFEEMGIDFLYVDEAHLFKNLNFNTKQGGIKGLSQRPSQRAYDLFMKIQYLEQARPGRSAVFMTGTPVSNSIAELYTMMRYLQLPTMKEYGIEVFDEWLQTFAEVTSQPEIAPNGRDIRETRSISKFVNLPELMNIYGMVADVQTPAMLNLPIPDLEGGAPIVVEAEMSDAEEAIMTDIVRRSEEVKGKKPEKGEDNILSIMMDGLKLATDIRLLQPDQPVNPDNKVGLAIDNIVREYEQGGEAPALAQIVFLDMGVPQSAAKAKGKAAPDEDVEGDGDIEMMQGRFDLYSDIKSRLIERGIPKDEIAFIHDANNDIKKARLFKAVKEGRVRILIGTTGKMGVGTNVQTNLVAMHHLDAPWRPADLEQRDGRILRQGNKNKSVRIYRYITTRSLDAVRWQQLERKSGFIAQLAAGARGLREAEDIDSPLPEASQIKAAATGDPRIMEHAELSKEIRVVEAQKRTQERQIIAARKQVEEMTAQQTKLAQAVEVFAADAAKVGDLSGDNFVMRVDVGTSGAVDITERKKAGEAIKAYLVAYAEGRGLYGGKQRLPVGAISGFQMEVEVERRVQNGEIVVQGLPVIVGEQSYFGERSFTIDEDLNPVSLAQRFEYVLNRIPVGLEERQTRLANFEEQIPKLIEQSQARPFAREEELRQMKARLYELELALDPEKRAKAEAEQAAAGGEPDVMAAASAIGPIARMMLASLRKNKPVAIADAVVRRTREAIEPDLRLVPADHDVGILTKIEPLKGADLVRATFTDPRTGSLFTVDLPGPFLLELAAARLPEKLTSTGRPAVVTASLSARAIVPESLRGKVRHEVIHALRRSGRLGDVAFNRLVDHADALDVLNMEADRFMAITQTPSDPFVPGTTLFDAYLERGKAMGMTGTKLEEMIFQEAVTHMVELAHHGYYSTEELAPVQDLLDAFERGELGGEAQGVDAEGVAAALQQVVPEATRIEDIPADVTAPHPGPVIAYHGTDEDFDTFNPGMSQDIGMHFGTVDQANDRIFDEDAPSRVIPVVIDLQNPLTMNDLGTWAPQAVYKSATRQGVEFTEAERDIFDGPIMEPDAAREVLQRAIQRAGYDGIRYLNRSEGVFDEAGNERPGARDKNGDLTSGWSYIVWEPGKVRSALTDNIMMAIRAFHYSPYHFDRFDLSRIGTGEGAQAYGHGLYFAENPAVAAEYKINLSVKAQGALVNGKAETGRAGTLALIAAQEGTDLREMAQFIRDMVESYRDRPQAAPAMFTDPASVAAIPQLEAWADEGVTVTPNEGATYDVELDVEADELVDMDRPITEQPEKVRKALEAVVEAVEAQRDDVRDQINAMLGNPPPAGEPITSPSQIFGMARDRRVDMMKVSPEEMLRADGVKGIRYFDAGSRAAQDGTRNIVLFDDSLVTITAKNGEPVTKDERESVLAALRRPPQRPEPARPGDPVSERFAEAAPEFAEALKAQVRQMLPADVAVRVADQIEYMGQELDAQFSPTKRVVTIAIDQGADRAMEVARHEAVHVARLMGLFTDNEWQILTERAAKIDPFTADAEGLAYYQGIYRAEGERLGLAGGDLAAYVREYIDQERVARMAEPGARYGRGIDGLLKRIGDFLEAIVNAARGLGFQSSRDIFNRLETGEIAQRRTADTVAGQSALRTFGLATQPAADVRAFGGLDFTGTVEMRRDEDGNRIRVYAVPEWGAASVIENDSGSWAVQFANPANADGLASLMVEIENDLGQYLAPDGWLTEPQYARWADLEPENIQGHRPAGGLFHGMYAPPRFAGLSVDVLAEVVAQSDDATTRAKTSRMAQELRSLRSQMAPELLPAARILPGQQVPGAGAIGSRGMGSDSTEAISARLSDLVEQFNRSVTAAPDTIGGPANMQRQGRMNPAMKRRAAQQGGWLAGLYSRATGVTRLAIPLDFVTLTHEGGHALETRADTRDAIDALKTRHAYDLIMPPAPDYQPQPFPPTGFTGLEIDAETLDALLRAYEAEMRLRSPNAPTGFTRSIVQEEAERAMATVERNIGKTPAGMALDDLIRRGVPPYQARTWAETRFAASGQPQPRVTPQYSDEQISEAWSNWFQHYMTAPDVARKQAPELFAEFADSVDGIDPGLLETLEELQEGYQQLVNASPVAALRSRIGSSLRPTAWKEFKQNWKERGLFTASVGAIGNLPAAINDFTYYLYRDYLDNKHPLKVAVKYLTDLAIVNNRISLNGNERVILKAIMDPYKRARLAEHVMTHATAVLQSGVRLRGMDLGTGPSYHDALTTAFGGSGASRWNEENVEKFGAYLIARRLEAEWQRYDNGDLPNPPDQLISRAAVNKARADLEKENPQFRQAAAQMYRFQQDVLEWQYQEGFITEDQYNDYSSRKDYAPLQRVMDQAGAVSALKSATGTNKAQMIKRFLGSTRDFINPLEQIAQNVYQVQSRVELNGIIRTLRDLAQAAGPGGGAIAEQLPANDMRATRVDLRQALKQAAKTQGIADGDLDAIMQEIDALFDEDAAAQIYRATEISDAGEQIMWLWEDGKRVPVLIGETEIARDIFQMFQNFGKDNTDFVMQAGVFSAQALRAGVTKAPAYIIVNYLRDQLATWVLSSNYTPFVAGARGLASISVPAAVALPAAVGGAMVGAAVGAPIALGAAGLAGGALVGKALTRSKTIDQEALAKASERYNYFAGLMGGIDSSLMSTSTQKREISALRKKGFWAVPGGTVIGRTWNGFMRTMEITEAATRVGHMDAVYKRALGDGMTSEEAAFEAAYGAHDVMDFSRRGRLMSGLSRLVPFLNASIQGMDALRRTLSGERNIAKRNQADAAETYRELATPYLKASQGIPLSKVERERLPLSAKAVVKMMGIGMVGLALAAYYDDDEEYAQFDDYMRATHWFFKVGDVWYRFPKPFELAFFSNLFEAAYSGFKLENPRAAEQFRASLWHTLTPPSEIQGMKLFYEMQTGKNLFTGRDIVPMGLEGKSPSEQYTSYTSELAKMIGATFNLSPVMVDHLLGGGFATVGRDIASISNTVLPEINELTGGALPGVRMTPRAEQSLEDRLLISRLTRRASRGALSTKKFSDLMNRAGGTFVMAASDYESAYNAGQVEGEVGARRLRQAKAVLDGLDDQRKAYALLQVNDFFDADARRLHPLKRAKDISSLAYGILREMNQDGIVKENSEGEIIHVSPSDQRKINEILSDVALREKNNALILTGIAGWAHKKIWPVAGLLEELRAVSPDVADEYERRQRTKTGKAKIFSFEAVRAAWPEAQSRILAEGRDADLRDLVSDAKAESR